MPSRLATLHSFGLLGISGYPVRVEVEVNERCMMVFRVVGLPDTTVSESRERVRSAIHASGFHFPGGRVIVNLAPADVRKEGPIFDLPIAAGILAAQGDVPHDVLERVGLIGELSLDGRVRSVRGALSLALAARRLGLEAIILALDNVPEASLVEGLALWPVETLHEAVQALRFGHAAADRPKLTAAPPPLDGPDLLDVRGLQPQRRALEVVAAGGHNLLMVGPPGSGKTMLAQRLPGILPPLTNDEALQVMQIHSAAGQLGGREDAFTQRPFRSPHHTASPAGIVGGGTLPRPGEISLAHGGVLFMDELPEFPRSVLEVLREPLESCHVTLARASTTVTFPADFIFVACMNPCPCGFDGDPLGTCRCKNGARNRYRSRISGPLLDRIDLVMEVPRDGGEANIEPSAVVRARVLEARDRQQRRCGRPNARLGLSHMRQHCRLDSELSNLLTSAARNRGLSARATDRLVRVTRTLADLDGVDVIEARHLREAIQMRSGEVLLTAV